jgi:hypothetical protein
MHKIKIWFYELVIYLYHLRHPITSVGIMSATDCDNNLYLHEAEPRKHFWYGRIDDLYTVAVICVYCEKNYPKVSK